MQQAIELALRGRYTAHPNPLVGCVIVKDGQVVAEGFHVRTAAGHAEANALADLENSGNSASGATVYVTLEPCSHHGRTPPCCDALIAAGIGRLVYGCEDVNPLVAGSGLTKIRAAGIRVDHLGTGGAAEDLNPGFTKRMRLGRPLVRVKLAMSLDGGTGLANGQSRWITGAAAREDVQRWRARSGAIVTGIGTVLADDPKMTVRLDQPTVTPLRVVMDSRGRLPKGVELLAQPGPVLQCVAPGVAGLQHPQVEIEQLSDRGAGGASGLDLNQLLEQLVRREVNEVWVEAGSQLATSFIRAELVDELIVYVAPVLLGEGAQPLLRMPELADMARRKQLKLLDTSLFDDDVRLTYQPLV